jgi:hypothetical protein
VKSKLRDFTARDQADRGLISPGLAIGGLPGLKNSCRAGLGLSTSTGSGDGARLRDGSGSGSGGAVVVPMQALASEQPEE